MKLLLNNKEIAHFLNSLLSYSGYVRQYEIQTRYMSTFLDLWVGKRNKQIERGKAEPLTKEEKKQFKDKLQKSIRQDLKEYIDTVTTTMQDKKVENFHKIHTCIEQFVEKFGEEKIFEAYKNSKFREFVKATGFNIDPNAQLMRRKNFTNYEEDCLIRNTVGNEELLVTKIDKKYPFWFIDSGYTNFLEPNKKWHRLVRNHLHYGEYFQAPTDRLGSFNKYPTDWRKDGDIIYIIEPGPFAASIFHCDLKTWKYDVEKELRKYTDKKIKFREKKPLRERTNLFEELKNDDYYCVVSINSNAATEAIWAGVPAITLDKHVTNPVTKSSLSDINDLYYGPLGNWLAFLSYNQFTKEELMNGTAHKLVSKYNASV